MMGNGDDKAMHLVDGKKASMEGGNRAATDCGGSSGGETAMLLLSVS